MLIHKQDSRTLTIRPDKGGGAMGAQAETDEITMESLRQLEQEVRGTLDRAIENLKEELRFNRVAIDDGINKFYEDDYLDVPQYVITEAGNRLLRIQGAMERMENGTYGVCPDCGREISRRRLEVLPETELCIECSSKREVPRHTHYIFSR